MFFFTVDEIRKLIKGLAPHELIEFNEETGVTVFTGKALNTRRKVSRKDVYLLLDEGVSQAEIARILKVSRQAIYYIASHRFKQEIKEEAP